MIADLAIIWNNEVMKVIKEKKDNPLTAITFRLPKDLIENTFDAKSTHFLINYLIAAAY